MDLEKQPPNQEQTEKIHQTLLFKTDFTVLPALKSDH